MPSLSLQKLRPRRSLRMLQTAFRSTEASSDLSSPSSVTQTSKLGFRGLDNTLDSTSTTLVLDSDDQHGLWPRSASLILSPSTSSPSTSTSPGSPVQEPWKPETWPEAHIPGLEPRGLRRVIRKKKSKVELLQVEERQLVRGELLGMVEPRPSTGVATGGIEEVLHGEA